VSVTGFLRSNRGVQSEIDDTFTIVLEYSGPQSGLIVTIKTAVITPMKDQLKYFIRGTKGSYLKVSISLYRRQHTHNITNSV
jgi:predicted dehydrogenase